MDAEIFAVVLGFGSLALCIALLAANWKTFTKAGRAGWKSIVPIYGTYVAFDIAGVKKLFPVSLIVGFAYAIMMPQVMPQIDYYGNWVGGNAELYSVLSIVYAIVMITVQVKYVRGLARSFGKGGGFAAGLFFLAPIFVMILGFGSAQYVGEIGAQRLNEGGAAIGWRCSCGTMNTPDSHFCKNCGKPSGWRCSCGTTNSPDAYYCKNCGNRMP